MWIGLSKKKKIYRYFEMSFSYFGPFGVRGMTIPIPEGTLATTPIPEGIPRVAPPLQRAVEEATSSQPSVKEEEEEEDRGVVELTDSEDEFTVFNQPLSPDSPFQADNP